MNSRFTTRSAMITSTARNTGLMTRDWGIPAAASAVSSLWRWIQVTVNMAAISATMLLVVSKNESAR